MENITLWIGLVVALAVAIYGYLIFTSGWIWIDNGFRINDAIKKNFEIRKNNRQHNMKRLKKEHLDFFEKAEYENFIIFDNQVSDVYGEECISFNIINKYGNLYYILFEDSDNFINSVKNISFELLPDINEKFIHKARKYQEMESKRKSENKIGTDNIKADVVKLLNSITSNYPQFKIEDIEMVASEIEQILKNIPQQIQKENRTDLLSEVTI